MSNVQPRSSDPFPYRGTLRTADGKAPFNQYFWPTQSWVFYAENTGPHVDYSFRVEFIALADGRFATYGATYSIDENRDPWGRPCVYPTKEQAIRVSAARMIRLCRRAVRDRWSLTGLHRAPEIIAWARHVVDRETGRKATPIAPFKMPAPLKPDFDGLPLFQWGAGDA